MLRISQPLFVAAAALAACTLAGCGEQSKPVALPAMPAANVVTQSDSLRPSPDHTAAGAKPVEPMQVTEMIRGYCYAGSRLKDKDAPGGLGPSENMPHKVTTESALAANSVYLLAQPDVLAKPVAFSVDPDAVIHPDYMRLVLVNTTGETIAFDASDSRLSIIQQAKDADGNWQPIEYLPQSWCGNSYHQVFLPAGEFWSFAAPRYEGEIKTTLRFVLLENGEPVLISNEFEGSVNAAQFSEPQPYNPKGIMDPYAAVE